MDNLEPITRNEMFLNGDDLEPITREEMILAGADLEPLTRHEWFLKKYRGGGDVTIERLAVTENGTYSESGKAYSPVVVNVPTPPVPENAYLLNSLSGLPADIASFNDGTDLPMASLKVAVTPYQDLHGYDAPWAGGAGKNKLDIANASLAKPSWYSGGWNNASLNSDYGLTIKRTYNEGGAGGFTIDNLVGGKTYTISFAVSDANLQYRVGIYYSTNGTDTTTLVNSLSMQSGTGIKYYSFDLPSEAKYVCFRPTLNDGTSPYDIYKIQIEEGSSATSFAPYSNICPISGWDEAVVTRCGKNLIPYVEFGILNQTNGSEEYNTTNKRTGFIRVLPNTQYSISGLDGSGISIRIFEYKKDKTYIRNYVSSNITNSVTIQTGAEVGYIRFQGNETIFASNVVQCEFGSTATAYEPYNGATYTIDLDGTRYGGVVDVVNGDDTDTLGFVDLGTLDWFYYTDGTNPIFYASINGIKNYLAGDTINGLCSNYKNYGRSEGRTNLTNNMPDQNFSVIRNSQSLAIRDDNYTDVTAFKTAMNGVQLVYELATPITVQLAPTPVKSLEGENKIFANCGQITEGKYFKRA